MALRVFVPGTPRPQGSMRAMVIGGKARVFNASHDTLAQWRHSVTAASVDLWGDHPPFDGPVAVKVDFALPRPPSIPRKRWAPIVKPDVDKLARAVLDALTGVVFTDDARVVSLVAEKHYAEGPTGAHIAVEPLQPDPGPDVELVEEQPQASAQRVTPDAVGTQHHSSIGAGIAPLVDRLEAAAGWIDHQHEPAPPWDELLLEAAAALRGSPVP